LELEKLASLSIEYSVYHSPLLQRAFYRLMESIGTRQFLVQYSLVYKYIIMQRDCGLNRNMQQQFNQYIWWNEELQLSLSPLSTNPDSSQSHSSPLEVWSGHSSSSSLPTLSGTWSPDFNDMVDIP
jgi:hypothetical protein